MQKSIYANTSKVFLAFFLKATRLVTPMPLPGFCIFWILPLFLFQTILHLHQQFSASLFWQKKLQAIMELSVPLLSNLISEKVVPSCNLFSLVPMGQIHPDRGTGLSHPCNVLPQHISPWVSGVCRGLFIVLVPLLFLKAPTGKMQHDTSSHLALIPTGIPALSYSTNHDAAVMTQVTEEHVTNQFYKDFRLRGGFCHCFLQSNAESYSQVSHICFLSSLYLMPVLNPGGVHCLVKESQFEFRDWKKPALLCLCRKDAPCQNEASFSLRTRKTPSSEARW